ncbi:MAG: hypothetical protein N2439_00970, partial [Anaerolineae bacterium]|nr:hypothetical protein [Anaerolineae bacterium]
MMFRFLLLAILALPGLAAAAAEPIAATYQLTVRDGDDRRHAQFLLLRSDDVVEVHDRQSGVIERWEREPGGRLYYLRIFPDAGRVVEFQPTDFSAAQIASDWDVIRTVTGTAVLDQLEPRGTRRVAGQRAVVYRGTVHLSLIH